MLERSRHCLLGWGLGVVVSAISFLTLHHSVVPPEMWEAISVAARLRPPADAFPLLWHHLFSIAVEYLGIANCIALMKFLGCVSLGLAASLSFFLFSGIPHADLTRIAARSRFCRRAIEYSAVVCALLFVFSPPVWLSCRVFTPEMLMLLMSLGILLAMKDVVATCRYRSLLVVGIVSGILAAQTPLGFVPPVFCVLYFKFKDWKLPNNTPRPMFANPIVVIVGIRRMCFTFALFAMAAAIFNFSFFIDNRPNFSDGYLLGSLSVLTGYFLSVKNDISFYGLVIVLAFVVAPLVIALASRQRLCNSDELLPVRYIFFLLACSLFAIFQASGFAVLHFWRWMEGEIASEYILCLGLLGVFLTLFIYINSFLFDVYFRSHVRILRQVCPQALDERNPFLSRLFASYKALVKVMRKGFLFLLLVVAAIVLPLRLSNAAHEASRLVNDIAAATAAECAHVDMLFTDGSMDAPVEVAAALMGNKLKTISMMSKSSAYEIELRTRNETNELRRALLAESGAAALRAWVFEHDASVTNLAVQLGAELWRNNRHTMPRAGGLVMHTFVHDDKELLDATGKSRLICKRALDICKKYNFGESGYQKLDKYLSFCLWRLSRMCRMRAHEADLGQRREDSEMETKFADDLEEANPQWQKVRAKTQWLGKDSFMRLNLTPREGLRIGLGRADFNLAKPYAQRILQVDPDNVKAHYALGMWSILNLQYGRAEDHLRKCLKKSPNEPAVLNNLAIVLLRVGRLDEAMEYAGKALKIMPNAKEIRTTIKHIREARKKKPSLR